MKNNIPCEMIKDVLPSYVDKLTSEVTNNIVEEHVSECVDCKNTLDAMQEGEKDMNISEEDQKEIDFLKKNKMKNRRVIIGCVAAVAVIIIAIFVKTYIIGEYNADEVSSNRMYVNKNKIDYDLWLDDDNIRAVGIIDYKEKDGIVDIKVRTVKYSAYFNFTENSMYSNSYTAKSEIEMVRVNGIISWYKGKQIAVTTARLYELRNKYIGDISKDNKIAEALKMKEILGDYTSELQTSNEPYGWTLILQKDISKQKEELRAMEMKVYAYYLIALIDNLDEVTYKYTIEGESNELKVTKEEATMYLTKDIKNQMRESSNDALIKYLGDDIKDCMTDIRVLDLLEFFSGRYQFISLENAEIVD